MALFCAYFAGWVSHRELNKPVETDVVQHINRIFEGRVTIKQAPTTGQVTVTGPKNDVILAQNILRELNENK